MVDVIDIFLIVLIVIICGACFLLIAVMIYIAIYDHLELDGCKPLNNETSICYYKSANNSTKVTTKIISNR